MATPIFGIDYLEDRQTGAATKVNDAFNTLETFVTCLVLTRGENTPDASPGEGDTHIIGSSPTGPWSGHANEITAYFNGWIYWDPSDGDGLPVVCYVNDEKVWFAYSVQEDEWHPLQKYHSTSEQWTGRYDRNGGKLYCKTVNVGSLPASTSSTDAHGITGLNKCIVISGFADNGTNQIPLPYYHASNGVEVYVDDTNINIVTTDDKSGYSGDVYLEYTKT